MNEPFKLTSHERINPLWRRIEQHLEDRLAVLRAKNDSDLDPNETARLRGRILEIKSLLDIGQDAPEAPDD